MIAIRHYKAVRIRLGRLLAFRLPTTLKWLFRYTQVFSFFLYAGLHGIRLFGALLSDENKGR